MCVQSSVRPFFEAGLRGEGEIVSCGDTGVDSDLCYFHDEVGTGLTRVCGKQVKRAMYTRSVKPCRTTRRAPRIVSLCPTSLRETTVTLDVVTAPTSWAHSLERVSLPLTFP